MHSRLIFSLQSKFKFKNQYIRDSPSVVHLKWRESLKLRDYPLSLRRAFNEDLEISAKRWLKTVNACIRKSFKKVRIGKYKTDAKLESLFHQKEYLMEALARFENDDKIIDVENTKEKLDKVVEDIAIVCCEKNKKIVDDYLASQNDEIEGFSQAKTWKLKKRLAPKNTIDPPAAKKDKFGNLVTDKDALEALYIDTYRERLKPNIISDDLKDLKSLKEYLFNLRFKYASGKITSGWTIEDLEKVLKSLKNGKSRDPHDHIYMSFTNMQEKILSFIF